MLLNLYVVVYVVVLAVASCVIGTSKKAGKSLKASYFNTYFMALDVKLLIYFDMKSILSEMKTVCEDFLEELNDKTICKFPSFRYLLEIDVMDCLEIFPDVGDFLLKEPVKFISHCNDLLFACLTSLDSDILQHIKPSQVAMNLRLKCLPRFLRNPSLRKYSGITLIQGSLIDISKSSNYVYHTVWSCPDECENNDVILPHIPKLPPKCYLCKNILFENSGLRKCGEKVEATFKLKDELLPRKFTIVDDLILKLKLGRVYVIHVSILRKATSVWSIEEVTHLPAPLTAPIPQDIKELFDTCNGIPWKFIYCLASTIGASICPLNNFINAKIGLLMSLASVKANANCGSPILHFLAGGYDTGYIRGLMTQAALLADSKVFLGMSNCSVLTSLIGASGGVCILPLPLQTYTQKQIHSMLSIIETGEITHGKAKVKLQCAVWAHGMDFKKIILYNVGSVFGTVCRGDYGEFSEELADFNLEQAINPSAITNEEKQALKDVSFYLDIVSNIKITLEEGAEHLLRSYFLAARKERPKALTIGNLEALVSTCSTSARLCRRQVANIHDAIFAIWLHVTGMPEPRFAPEEYLETPADIKKLQKVMGSFTEWLEQFTGRIPFY